MGLLSAYIGWRAIKGDEKYAFIGDNAVAIAAFGGTCFRDADLTDADFSAALLKNTNLKSEKLIRTCWRNAKKLDLARVGKTILSQPAVRELLVTGKGHRKSFVDFNLRGANLTEADLSYANLKQADLSQAVLRGAILEGAILTETNCVGADFTAATLTAACLEAWNIDSSTTLEQVNCDYVFLLEEPNSTGSRERRPHDPDAVFQPGDFEKLYRKIQFNSTQ
ncbi:MAG: pentapeptide repeat-containing protein [Cyanobacteria bacterium J06592_8]